ncbi:hypothetical protein Hsero_2813 [Herbaspirillum seropedicae SmR1]|uniref:Uncharacterized protein n=1 Tax=Herbaspirillum seropedicae (strain SmR1) TaxID=757424 RepID=D8IYX1_HERSS|nr:hypothetical protein Hsero_2813 [Herbaspirillum seropedicae SmR1]
MRLVPHDNLPATEPTATAHRKPRRRSLHWGLQSYLQRLAWPVRAHDWRRHSLDRLTGPRRRLIRSRKTSADTSKVSAQVSAQVSANVRTEEREVSAPPYCHHKGDRRDDASIQAAGNWLSKCGRCKLDLDNAGAILTMLRSMPGAC